MGIVVGLGLVAVILSFVKWGRMGGLTVLGLVTVLCMVCIVWARELNWGGISIGMIVAPLVALAFARCRWYLVMLIVVAVALCWILSLLFMSTSLVGGQH